MMSRQRAACSAPQMRTAELDPIMVQIFNQLAQDKSVIMDAVIKVIQAVPNEHDYHQDVKRVKKEDLDICLKFCAPYGVVFDRENSSFCFTRLILLQVK